MICPQHLGPVTNVYVNRCAFNSSPQLVAGNPGPPRRVGWMDVQKKKLLIVQLQVAAEQLQLSQRFDGQTPAKEEEVRRQVEAMLKSKYERVPFMQNR